jgi:protein O-mannosyl-transferase
MDPDRPIRPWSPGEARLRRWGPLLIAGLVLLAYFPALRGGFIWDDDTFLTANPLIKAPDGLRRFWLTTEPTDYWPVTSSTLWAEWRLWGAHAAGYHATNVALHLAETLLLWAVLRRLRIPGAFLAAALFAVHPVNVESVAWITQRKNLMAMLFYLLSVYGFLRGEEAAESGRPGFFWRGASLLGFVLAMLSKGSVAMLPVVLLGIVAARRRPAPRDFPLLLPFFVVAGGFTALNLLFKDFGPVYAVRTAGLAERLLEAAAIVLFYLSKAVAPVRLMFVYPRWSLHPGAWISWLPLAGCAALTVLLWRHRRTWARAPLWAWAYFCVSLVPVMGFTDVYFMRYSLVADHYQHLALIGIAALAGAGLSAWRARWSRAAGPRRSAPGIAAAAIVAALAVLTWRQCALYADSETLYRASIERNPASAMLWNNLGVILAKNPADLPEAIHDFEAAERLSPAAMTRDNLGDALTRSGRLPEAVDELETALQIDPQDPRGHNNLGNAFYKAGRLAEAIEQYRIALQLDPRQAEAHCNLGQALAGDLAAMPDRLPEAIGQYEEALRLNPDFAPAHRGLANLLTRVPGRLPDVIAHYEAALRLAPDDPESQNNLAVAYFHAGRRDEALAHLRIALQLNPAYRSARENLRMMEAAPGP